MISIYACCGINPAYMTLVFVTEGVLATAESAVLIALLARCRVNALSSCGLLVASLTPFVLFLSGFVGGTNWPVIGYVRELLITPAASLGVMMLVT